MCQQKQLRILPFPETTPETTPAGTQARRPTRLKQESAPVRPPRRTVRPERSCPHQIQGEASDSQVVAPLFQPSLAALRHVVGKRPAATPLITNADCHGTEIPKPVHERPEASSPPFEAFRKNRARNCQENDRFPCASTPPDGPAESSLSRRTTLPGIHGPLGPRQQDLAGRNRFKLPAECLNRLGLRHGRQISPTRTRQEETV